MQALRGLERINWLSGSCGILWPDLLDLAREQAGQPLRILDVACGAGDLTIRLWKRARKAGLAWTVEGCDISATALSHARQRAASRGADVRFFQADVFAEPLSESYDAVISSLFLHHLEEARAVELLRHMAQSARSCVLINDLERSSTGYWLAYVGTRLLSRSEVVHVDGPRSVEGAFTVAEARQLAELAGLSGATVSKRWPCRYLLRWRRP